MTLQVGKVRHSEYKPNPTPTLPTSRVTPMKEHVLGTAKISTKAQVTIPVDVRKKFKLEIGDLLIFAEDDGKLVVRKA